MFDLMYWKILSVAYSVCENFESAFCSCRENGKLLARSIQEDDVLFLWKWQCSLTALSSKKQ